jgi:hypothetical protein
MSTTEMAAPAGWYAVGGGHERYWEGSAWTERVRAIPAYVRVEPRADVRREVIAFLARPEFTFN